MFTVDKGIIKGVYEFGMVRVFYDGWIIDQYLGWYKYKDEFEDEFNTYLHSDRFKEKKEMFLKSTEGE